MDIDERPKKLRKLEHIEQAITEDEGVESSHKASVESIGAQDTIPNNACHASPQQVARQLGSIANDTTGETAHSVEGQQISKKQQKRLRKKLEWESKREDRKVLRKEKTVAKRERKKAARADAIADGTFEVKPQEHILRKQLPITIIIDCDFDDLMHEGEKISLCSQVTRSYSDNKNARFRAHLTVSSFGGFMQDRFENLLDGMYKKWRGVRFVSTDFVDAAEQANHWMTAEDGGVLEGAFQKHKNEQLDVAKLKEQAEIVYLSAEADDVLHELKPYSTYIIGGIVDKNREKGLCHKRATQRGVKTARLPIGDYLDMSSRKVLTTNHVNEIMLKWLELADWGQSFLHVMPKRKEAQLKDSNSKEASLASDHTQDEAGTP